MIGRLRGVLLEKHPPHLLLEVAGVGYELELPLGNFQHLPALNETVTLYTHLVVREDAHLLYGFSSRRERELFRELIRLNGVGPKLALALLSALEVDALIRCVQADDVRALTRVPGVGKKTAERLLIELKDRFKAWDVLSDAPLLAEASASVANTTSHAERDAVSALLALGFKPAEASRAVTHVLEDGLSSEELIRRALKSMA